MKKEWIFCLEKWEAAIATPNGEIRHLFIGMIENWFVPQGKSLNYCRDFIRKTLGWRH